MTACPHPARTLSSRAGTLLLPALLLVGPSAWADDQTECKAGIAMVQAEIAKGPPEDILAKLKKALRVAEREQGEGEFDECVDAVGDARRALR